MTGDLWTSKYEKDAQIKLWVDEFMEEKSVDVCGTVIDSDYVYRESEYEYEEVVKLLLNGDNEEALELFDDVTRDLVRSLIIDVLASE